MSPSLSVYDLGPKTFLFKFALPDIKEMLLIESGVRCHTTTFQREKTTGHPSQFVMKLRKHIRTRRLAKVDQIGTDRIVDLQFGEDEFAVRREREKSLFTIPS